MRISPSVDRRGLRLVAGAAAAAFVAIVGGLHFTADLWHLSALALGAGAITLTVLQASLRRQTARTRVAAADDDARVRALLHSTLESTTDGILTVDLAGDIVGYNERFLEVWGITHALLEKRKEEARVPILEQVLDGETFTRRSLELRSEPEATGEDFIELRDGRILHRTTHPHRLDGRIIGRIWNFRDITAQRRTEMALAESERRFRRMVTNVPGVIFQFYLRRDDTLWFTYLSDGCQALLGVEPPGFPWRADSLVQRVHEDDMRHLVELVRRSAEQLAPWTWEGRVDLPDGRMRWLRAASRPTRHADGRMTWDGLLMDVTEEKLAAEALERREEQLAEAQALAHIGSWEWDLATNRVAVSAEHWRIFGYEPAALEWSYDAYLEAIHPDDRERVRQELEHGIAVGAESAIDHRIVRPNGVVRHITSRGKALRDGSGNVVRVVGTAQDVTEQTRSATALEKRIRVEQALTRAARFLSTCSSPDISGVLEVIARAVGADRAQLFQSRTDGGSLLFDSTHEWCAPGISSARAELQALEAARVPWWMEQLRSRSRLIVNRLDEIPASAKRNREALERHGVRGVVAVPLVDSALGVLGFVTLDHVASESDWSEVDVRALETTAEMLVAYFSRVRAERQVLRREGILRAVSYAAERFLTSRDWEEGLEEALAMVGSAAGVSRAILFQTHAGADGRIDLARRAEWVADGIEPWLQPSGSEMMNLPEIGLGRWEKLFRNGETVQGSMSTLPESEAASLDMQGACSVLHIPIQVEMEWWGTLAIDSCLEEREWSPTEVEALATAAGMISAAVQRKRSEEALRESEERFRQMAESMREVFFMVSVERELIYLSPSYEAVWGRSRSDIQGFIESILPEDRPIIFADMALSESGEGDPLRYIEYRIARPDGSVRWIRHRTFQIRDEEGRPYRVAGVCSDITEQKQLEEELRRTSRIEAIGHLAAGIAHEINTPIQYIGDNVRFLDESYGDIRAVLDAYAALMEEAALGPVSPERLVEVAATVERADVEYVLQEAPRASAQALDGVQRVAEIVRAMKEFSHPGSGQKVPTDLNQAIRSTTTVARNEWKYIAELVTDLDASLPPVLCHPGEINQAILNLVVNAAHAIADRQKMDGGEGEGIISVSTRHAGEMVEIRVSDTGIGIPAEIRDRVFDPFFTTKEVGRGTGQGLTLVHSVVVDKHGGSLSFETEPGIGTTFILRLPQAPTHSDVGVAA